MSAHGAFFPFQPYISPGWTSFSISICSSRRARENRFSACDCPGGACPTPFFFSASLHLGRVGYAVVAVIAIVAVAAAAIAVAIITVAVIAHDQHDYHCRHAHDIAPIACSNSTLLSRRRIYASRSSFAAPCDSYHMTNSACVSAERSNQMQHDTKCLLCSALLCSALPCLPACPALLRSALPASAHTST